jgi:branched-chain amino acid transport system substrate-binding protein
VDRGADFNGALRSNCDPAEAVKKAGSFDDEAVVDALRHNEFGTVLGRLGFDAKGDVTGYETFVWYVWKDGKYAPVEPGKLTE